MGGLTARTVLLGYLSSLLVIPPGLAAGTEARGARQELTLTQFVQKLEKDGKPSSSFRQVLPDFPEATTKKDFEAPAPQATDGIGRIASVVYTSRPGDKDSVPIGLSWYTLKKADGELDSYRYRSSLDGTLEQAARSDARLDAAGRPIHGSGKARKLDVQSTKVRERFQHEVLDFWLKGVGRKEAGSKSKKKAE